KDVALDRPDEDRVRRLLAREAGQPQTLARAVRLDQLPRRERRATGVEDLPLGAEVGQDGERFDDVRSIVRPMDLVEVDVVRAEASQALLELAHDRPARVAAIRARRV